MTLKPICLAVSLLCKKENNVYFQEEHHINIWRCQKHVPPFAITYVIPYKMKMKQIEQMCMKLLIHFYYSI